MSTKAFKYFHIGDEYSEVFYFVEDAISPFTEPGWEPSEPGDEILINKKIKITIEVYEDE